ncbi:MAG: UPF0175 family protein [candidate division KSB1 bacterium]|nr:UPF0175 family protein [candidate division KSB1 bacterium]
MRVTVEIPKQYFINYNVSEITHFLKLYTALLMFQEGQLSIGAACELAGVDRFTFMAACKKHNIPIIKYDVQEIETDVQRLKSRKEKQLCPG